jgi:hypothetical protein
MASSLRAASAMAISAPRRPSSTETDATLHQSSCRAPREFTIVARRACEPTPRAFPARRKRGATVLRTDRMRHAPRWPRPCDRCRRTTYAFACSVTGKGFGAHRHGGIDDRGARE